jgi:excisionase family DNA binding protein
METLTDAENEPAGLCPADPIKFLTIADVAELLVVATRTVRRWIERGELVPHRLGGAVRIAESDLKDFLALRRDGGA